MKTTKYIYLTLALQGVLISFSAKAGGDYGTFSIGYRMNHIYLGNVNRNVYLYNYTRQWLTDEMEYFTGMKGLEVSWEKRWDNAGLEFGYHNLQQKNHAEGPEPDAGGQLGQRDIMVGMIGLTCGPTVYLGGSDHFELKVGASLDADWFRINTSYNKGNPELIVKDAKLGSTLWVGTNLYASRRLGVGVKAYYQFFYKNKVDIGGMPYYFQGANYPYAVEDKINNYGVSLLLNIAGKGRSDFY
jgi:hypothetical protein